MCRKDQITQGFQRFENSDRCENGFFNKQVQLHVIIPIIDTGTIAEANMASVSSKVNYLSLDLLFVCYYFRLIRCIDLCVFVIVSSNVHFDLYISAWKQLLNDTRDAHMLITNLRL